MEKKTVTLNILYFVDDRDYELTISTNLTIKKLKDYIGELLHIKIKNPLKLKRVGKVKLALLYDEKQTIEQYKINNDDTIAIIKEDVEVGKKKETKF